MRAGKKIQLLPLDGKKDKTLDEFRVHKYYEKMSGQTQHSIKVEIIGLTSNISSGTEVEKRTMRWTA